MSSAKASLPLKMEIGVEQSRQLRERLGPTCWNSLAELLTYDQISDTSCITWILHALQFNGSCVTKCVTDPPAKWNDWSNIWPYKVNDCNSVTLATGKSNKREPFPGPSRRICHTDFLSLSLWGWLWETTKGLLSPERIYTQGLFGCQDHRNPSTFLQHLLVYCGEFHYGHLWKLVR